MEDNSLFMNHKTLEIAVPHIHHGQAQEIHFMAFELKIDIKL